MKLKPLDDRVVIRPADAEKKSPGGIVIPDVAKEKPVRGEVLAVGPGKMLECGTRHSMALKPGDVVLFAKYGGSEIEIDGVELKLMRESDVLAVIGQ